MGKKQTYTDAQLTQAVQKYADAYGGKIQVPAMVRWVRANLPGMENVTMDMFRRPSRRRTPEGETVAIERPCAVLIREINEERAQQKQLQRNLLLHSMDLDAFFGLPSSLQRAMAVDAREQFQKLQHHCRDLERRCRASQEQMDQMSGQMTELEEKLQESETSERQRQLLERRIDRIFVTMDEENRRAALGELGISDEGFRLTVQMKCREEESEREQDDGILACIRADTRGMHTKVERPSWQQLAGGEKDDGTGREKEESGSVVDELADLFRADDD